MIHDYHLETLSPGYSLTEVWVMNVPAKEEFPQWSRVTVQRKMAEQGVRSTTGEKFLNETFEILCDMLPYATGNKPRRR